MNIRFHMIMWQVNFKNIFKSLCYPLAVFILVGCSTTPKEQESGPVFYPPLPNPPRIQHLLSLTTFNDFVKSKSSFSDFILGTESTESLVKKPYGVALFQGKIYIVDAKGAGYVVLDLVTRKRKFVSGGAAGRMNKPINITIDTDGTKYISDTGRTQVLVFDKDDKFVKALGKEGQFKPSDVAITEDRLYITDLNSHTIKVLHKVSGRELSQIGRVGSKEGEFFYPTNLAIGPDKLLYVTDTGNYRVQKFTLSGEFIRRYGSIGSGLGKFARPKGLTLDKEGRLYVVDAAFENIQIVDKKGKLLLFFGQAGDKPADINLPADISINYDSVEFFQAYAHPKFKLEYVLLVSSQFGVNKINIFGYGRMEGMDYSKTEK